MKVDKLILITNIFKTSHISISSNPLIMEINYPYYTKLNNKKLLVKIFILICKNIQKNDLVNK